MLSVVLGAVVLLGAAAPAAPPEFPVVFMKVDELKSLVDRGVKVDVIDVRTRPEYDELHIKGARSLPLRTIPERVREIPRDRPVVLY